MFTFTKENDAEFDKVMELASKLPAPFAAVHKDLTQEKIIAPDNGKEGACCAQHYECY